MIGFLFPLKKHGRKKRRKEYCQKKHSKDPLLKREKKKKEFGVSCLDKDTHVLTLVTHCCQHSLQQHSIKMVKNRKNVSITFV